MITAAWLQTVKEQMVRAFSAMEPEVLRQTTKPEWTALLHNLCYLHGALRLRARYGRGGFNKHEDFMHIGNNELFVSLRAQYLKTVATFA